METRKYTRREFGYGLSTFGIGITGLVSPTTANTGRATVDVNINHIGPKEGFAPQIGTLISMLDWVSDSVIKYNAKLTIEQLDYLHDADSNTIGSLMMHLATTEVIYQDITFHDLKDFSAANKSRWNAAMELGEMPGNRSKVTH